MSPLHDAPYLVLRISKLTDYGVLLASHLAACWGSERPLRAVVDLAEASGLPAPTVSKVLKGLVRADVAVSVRGARGGYRLAAAPTEISVAQIVAGLEGPIAITECTDDSTRSPCAHQPRCGLQPNWQKINAVLLTALGDVTLADMLQSPEEGDCGCEGSAGEEQGLVRLGARSRTQEPRTQEARAHQPRTQEQREEL